MLWINKRQTIAWTSLIWVWAEQTTWYMLWSSIDATHIVLDSWTHLLLNTLHIHVHWSEKYIGKRWSRLLEASIDTLIHLLGKYGAHQFIHHLEHHHNQIEKVAIFGMNRLQELHDHSNTCSVSMLTLPVFVCLIAEQVYKNFFDTKFHAKQ
jgi:hypothetical protein